MNPAAAMARLTNLVPAHLRGVRHLWLYLSVVMLPVLLLPELVATVSDEEVVLAGFTFDHGLRVRAVLNAETGVEAWDQVLAMDGKPVADPAQLLATLRERGPGRRVSFTIDRSGGDLFKVSTTTHWLRFDLLRFSRLLAAGIWILSGWLLFWFAPVGGETLAFLLTAMAMGLNTGELVLRPVVAASSPWLAIVADNVAPWVLLASSVNLALLLPYPMKLVSRNRNLSLMIYALGIALGVGMGASYWASPAGFRALVTIEGLGKGLVLLAFVVCLAIRHTQPHPPGVRARLRAVDVSVLTIVPICGYSIFLAITGREQDQVVWGLMTASVAAFPVVLAYSVYRHELWRVDQAVARTIAYGGTAVVVGGIYVVASVLLPTVLAPEAMTAGPGPLTVAIATALLVLWPVQRTLVRRVNAYLRRFRLDLTARLRSVRELLALMATQPLERNCVHLQAVLAEILDVDEAVLLRPKAGKGYRRIDGERAAPDGACARASAESGFAELHSIVADGRELAVLALGATRPGHERSNADRTTVLQAWLTGASQALAFFCEQRRIGDFRLVGFLGAGGMGAVYLAVREGLGATGQRYAIKQILPKNLPNKQYVTHFLEEGHIARQLNHPNIVRIEEVGESAEGCYLVMEHVEGCDAQQLIMGLNKDDAQMSVACAVQAVTDLCRALDYAHTAKLSAPQRSGRQRTGGLIHRDISPDNILISRAGEVRLVDFGVATVGSKTKKAAGKLHCLAPEIIDEGMADHRVDVYGAGLVLYELCTGDHPFRQVSGKETVKAVLRGRHLRADALRRDLPLEVAELIERTLQRDPCRRFATAGDMADALQERFPTDAAAIAELGRLASRYGVTLTHREPSEPEPPPKLS